ncbi:Hypothetical_protein [Hexamita inflata]|uniref:Hypothetical_protein n=1 Tax=Hexamita inflata TaxID=28002 RepID=A0ABP1GGG4_9EUKA
MYNLIQEFYNLGYIKLRFPLQLVSEEGEKDRGAHLGYRSLEGRRAPGRQVSLGPLGGQPEASGETQTTNYNNLKYQIPQSNTEFFNIPFDLLTNFRQTLMSFISLFVSYKCCISF